MTSADIAPPEGSSKTRYWVSWYQPTEDYRPLSDPPNQNILGWWCSGSRLSDDARTLCAVVLAVDEEHAKTAVTVDWPEAVQWRFVEEKSIDFVPGDRFPIGDGWERQRLMANGSDI